LYLLYFHEKKKDRDEKDLPDEGGPGLLENFMNFMNTGQGEKAWKKHALKEGYVEVPREEKKSDEKTSLKNKL